MIDSSGADPRMTTPQAGDDSAHPGIATRIKELLAATAERVLTVNDLGAWEDLPSLVAALVDNPLLVPVVHLTCEAAGATPPSGAGMSPPDEAIPAISRAICTAILSTQRPALFRDSLEGVLECAPILTHCGRELATEILSQAQFPTFDTEQISVLRAATALEYATRLRLGNWADRWDLFAHLAASPGPAPEVYTRAVVRAIGLCIDAWTEAESLSPALERVAGLTPTEGTFKPPTDPEAVRDVTEAIQSDAGIALSRVAVLRALRAPDTTAAISHLDHAIARLSPAIAEDDRVDVMIAVDVASLLRALLSARTVPDDGLIDRISSNVREYLHFSDHSSHWIGDRIAASNAAWSRLVLQLQGAHRELSKPSWYNPPAVIDNIVDLYRTTGSQRLFCRAEDDRAVRGIIAPSLEEGFAESASLLRHLEDHVAYLQNCVDAGTATAEQTEDLPVAIRLRDHARTRLVIHGGTPPKRLAGDANSPADSTATPAFNAPNTDRVMAAVLARRESAMFTTGSLVADQLLEKARLGFSSSPDYQGDVRDAVDSLTLLLVTFLHTRTGLSDAAAPYLYDHDASEEDLARDLQTFIASSGHLGSVRTEVRRIAGGRTDVEFAFPGFNLYVELKADSTKKPLPEKKSYLKQAASYQNADKRIGFLLALKRVPPKTIATWLGDALDVIEVADTNGGIRHVAALTLSAGRTTPSSM